MSKGSDDCREKALRLLDQRMHSAAELRRKLESGRFDNQAIDTVLADFRRLNLLDDKAFAEAYCREKQGGARPLGEIRLRADLKRRGIAGEIIREVLNACAEESDETAVEQAVRSAESKLRLLKPDLPRRDAYARLCRFLAGRGFPPDVCRTATETLLKTWADNN